MASRPRGQHLAVVVGLDVQTVGFVLRFDRRVVGVLPVGDHPCDKGKLVGPFLGFVGTFVGTLMCSRRHPDCDVPAGGLAAPYVAECDVSITGKCAHGTSDGFALRTCKC